jgi:anti-anti-sigma factor
MNERIRRWLAPHAAEGLEEQTRREYILNTGVLGALVMIVPYFLLSILGRLSTPPFTREIDIPISTACFATLVLAYVLSRRGWIGLSSVIVILLAVLVPSGYFYFYQDVDNPGVILYAVPIVVAGLLLGIRGSATVATLISLIYIGLSWYTNLVAGQPIWPLNWIAVIGAVGLIALSVWFYMRETDRALQRLRQQTQELQATHQEKSQLVDDLQALVARQRELLELVGELSAPLIPIQEGVIVLPLIGHIDEARAEQIHTALLEGVAAHRARVVVIDVTGVPTVDSTLAQVLRQMAQGVRLMGATCVLSGLRPEGAHTLSRLGARLDLMVTRADVQSGIEYAQQAFAGD